MVNKVIIKTFNEFEGRACIDKDEIAAHSYHCKEHPFSNKTLWVVGVILKSGEDVQYLCKDKAQAIENFEKLLPNTSVAPVVNLTQITGSGITAVPNGCVEESKPKINVEDSISQIELPRPYHTKFHKAIVHYNKRINLKEKRITKVKDLLDLTKDEFLHGISYYNFGAKSQNALAKYLSEHGLSMKEKGE